MTENYIVISIGFSGCINKPNVKQTLAMNSLFFQPNLLHLISLRHWLPFAVL